jgi:outer membrane protein assembly factor BamB
MRFVSTTACFLSFTGAANAATVNWPQPGLNAAHTGYNKKETTISAGNIGSLTQKWAVPIPNGIQGAAPIEMRGVAYAQATDGTVYAVKTKTGKLLWTYEAGQPLGLAVGGALVYTTCKVDANGHNGVCALNAATGALTWSFTISNVNGQVPTSSGPDNVPVYDHGKVLFGETYGGFNSPVSGDNVVALNAATGAPIWQIAESPDDRSDGLPFAIDKGEVFYQTGGASVFICGVKEADGSAAGCTASLGGGGASVSVSGGRVLTQNDDGNGNTLFTAFSETSLALAWQLVISGNTSDYSIYPPAVANGLVYFYAGSNGFGSLYALSLKTGAQRWSYTCNGTTGCLNSGVSVANGVLFASCDAYTSPKGDQCAFDAKTGAQLRSYGSTDGHAGTEATPLVANGAVIGACGAYGGNLCEFVP